MEKRPTIKDVAEMAGVAKSTVSRYLNGKPVQEESGRRIRRAIEHYNYEANVFARLSAKQSHIIGIILPGLDSTVTPRMLTAMDRYLRAKDYTPLIINTAGDLDFEVRSIGDLARMRVDGIILVASYITPAHRRAVEAVQLPVVFTGQEFGGGISVTGFGGYDTSELLTPPLTSIRFDAETEACICADTVLRMLRGEPVSKTQLIGYHFVEGGSVL